MSEIHKKLLPKLDLGSVLYSAGTGYLLCLQATCDTVRGDGQFFFVPLTPNDESPDIVVPHGKKDHEPNFIGLTLPAKCYQRSRSVNFGAINERIGHIPVCYDRNRGIYHVLDAESSDFRWLANLKYKRALRFAQNVSQEISRIGFDEFEPFRK